MTRKRLDKVAKKKCDPEGEKIDKEIMTGIALYMKQKLLIGTIEGYLQKECKYGYKDRTGKAIGKPELVLQGDIRDLLKDDYEVENPCSIDTSILAVRPTLYEQQWEIDLKVSNEDVLCYIEMKYDELKDNGSSTNPQSEDEILRDIYKLQCIKRTFQHALCLMIFATDNPIHWKKFIHIKADKYTIPYEGKDETFKLLSSYSIKWEDSFKKVGYKYFILEI